MQFKTSTDYAVRMVLFLAQHSGYVGGEELSRNSAIPPTMLVKIANPLQEAGILVTRRGNRGGFALAKHPAQITLADIVRAIEGTTRINRCLEADCACALGRADSCPVRGFYTEVQDWLDRAFEGRSIASFLAEA